MMQRRWLRVVVVGLLSVTACRRGTSGDRSPSEHRSVGDTGLHVAPTPEREAAAARTLAAMRAASRGEIEMAVVAGQRAQTSDVRGLAARIVQQRTEDLEAIARLGRERAIDLRVTDADPMIQADLAAGRDALDRLARASSQELDALYLMLEVPGAIRLSRLGDQAEGLARDPESASILRRIAAQARDAQARAFALLPRECGGQHDVVPAATPHTIPAFEDPPGDAGSPRPRGAISPATTDL
jgi:uncharacterized protein (DUF305 family)